MPWRSFDRFCNEIHKCRFSATPTSLNPENIAITRNPLCQDFSEPRYNLLEAELVLSDSILSRIARKASVHLQPLVRQTSSYSKRLVRSTHHIENSYTPRSHVARRTALAASVM